MSKRSTSPYKEYRCHSQLEAPSALVGLAGALASNELMVGLDTDFANHFDALQAVLPVVLDHEGTNVLLTFYLGKPRSAYSMAGSQLPAGLHRISSSAGALQGFFGSVIDFVKSSAPTILTVAQKVLEHYTGASMLQGQQAPDDLQAKVAQAFMTAWVDLSDLLN